jgi:hypothetical protein
MISRTVSFSHPTNASVMHHPRLAWGVHRGMLPVRCTGATWRDAAVRTAELYRHSHQQNTKNGGHNTRSNVQNHRRHISSTYLYISNYTCSTVFIRECSLSRVALLSFAGDLLFFRRMGLSASFSERADSDIQKSITRLLVGWANRERENLCDVTENSKKGARAK